MKKFLLFSVALTLSLALFSHPWKPRHYIIIDTDGGIDDIRTISMLLASPDVRVLAITVSPGSLDADNSYIKVKSLLNSFYHEGIPVGINRTCNFKSPEFADAENYTWGNTDGINTNEAPGFLDVIEDIFENEESNINMICLGSLSTPSLALSKLPLFREKVKDIIWCADGLNEKKGFNYNIDTEASKNIMKDPISLKVIKGLDEELFYDDSTITAISEIPTIYAKAIYNSFKINSDHSYYYSANDEMVALWLHYPEQFITNTNGTRSESSSGNIHALQEKCRLILAGETVAKNQVIKNFPVDPEFYFTDIEPSVNQIIDLYGIDEWTSGVIANELHRHLGVFAIVGVKMGIRAREYFNTGVDEFSAYSFAGSIPPLSCMNDGLQVSTGATPGHGLLKISDDLPAVPSVLFTYMNRKIRLTLKPELNEKISSELKEINFIYGLDSDIYWELVRKNSIKYWLSLDRHDIFDITEE